MEKKASDYIHSLPEKVPAERIMEMETVLHFIFTGEEEDEITLSIESGEMETREGLHGEPECVIRAKSEHFVMVVQGEMNPLTAVMTGKIKVSNQMAILRYASLLGLT